VLIAVLCLIATALEGGAAMIFTAVMGVAVHLATMVGSRVEGVIAEDIVLYCVSNQTGVMY
jgi:hypothetical protein